MTSKLTWTFGMRATHNANPLNPHDAVARLPGSFASISHDVNQPLNAAIQTGLGNIFASTPLAILQPRTAHGLSDRAAHGAADRLRPVQRSAARKRRRSGGRQSPLLPDLSRRLTGHRGRNGHRAGSARQRHRCDRRRKSDRSARASPGANSPAHHRSPIPIPVCQPVAITAVPDGKLHAPYFMQWSFGLEHQIGDTINLRAQYVGTRAVNQPYTTQVNGYQTVCQGCFAPFPYGAPGRSPIRRRDATHHRRQQPLQRPPNNRRKAARPWLAGPGELHLEPLHRYRLERRLLIVLRRQEFFRRFLATSSGIAAPAITMCATTSPPATSMNCRSSCAASCGRALNGWQISGSVFWHSGLPFSVLSAPYSANGNGIVNGSGPQFASVVPGVPLYDHNPIPGVTQPGTIQWLNPNAFVSTVDPSYGRMRRRRYSAELPVWKPGPQCAAGSRFHLERSLPHQMVRSE